MRLFDVIDCLISFLVCPLCILNFILRIIGSVIVLIMFKYVWVTCSHQKCLKLNWCAVVVAMSDYFAPTRIYTTFFIIICLISNVLLIYITEISVRNLPHICFPIFIFACWFPLRDRYPPKKIVHLYRKIFKNNQC